MKISEIKKLLMKNIALDEVYVNVTGRHFKIIAVSELFADMSSVKKQQIIYTPLMEHILKKRIHALSIKVYTPKEWQFYRKFKIGGIFT
ncbi:transcriptional regulator BolA [Candidatus Mikella endobia]|uniref:Transcriptional regulator BolA n=1 Tax=Candidatus Mikella endobia TaxID=1778264 RepID=A0A143WPP4_9ENTR|nr:BolA family protein [Candidatus Mikella endobia]CUX95653.1 transcriptional regulator BolA [Candidatus Mikella endobia]